MASLAQLKLGAAAASNAEQRRPTMRGFKIAHSKLGNQLRNARARLSRLLNQRRDAPERVAVRDLKDGAVVKLATERKHLTNIIKIVAYQAESDLIALLRPHYARADQEGPDPAARHCRRHPRLKGTALTSHRSIMRASASLATWCAHTRQYRRTCEAACSSGQHRSIRPRDALDRQAGLSAKLGLLDEVDGRVLLVCPAAGGQVGVEWALGNLRAEIERHMKLMGCRAVEQLSRADA
jgi:hypothetical protein